MTAAPMRRSEDATPCKACGSKALRCIETRHRNGYRYRMFVCDNCQTRRTSAEFIIDIEDRNVNRKQVLISMLSEFATDDLLKELLRRFQAESSG
jgi:protein-arginine kinase activator protein McsA